MAQSSALYLQRRAATAPQRITWEELANTFCLAFELLNAPNTRHNGPKLRVREASGQFVFGREKDAFSEEGFDPLHWQFRAQPDG